MGLCGRFCTDRPNCRGGRNDTHLLAFITNKESQGCWLYKEETHHIEAASEQVFSSADCGQHAVGIFVWSDRLRERWSEPSTM